MSETIEVGRRYRNSSGEYEILSIDGMWATVQYEGGETKRHLTAALQIHWENDQAQAVATAAQEKAARPARTRQPKAQSPFPADETNAIIAELLNTMTTSDGQYVTRQAIVEALMADARGAEIISTTHKALFYRTPEWIAGSMLDQFGKDITRKGSPVRDKFEREQIENVWAYRPK